MTATTYNTDAAASAALTNTPGCWSVGVQYQLDAACGGAAINAVSTIAACDPVTTSAVIFPPLVDITVSNTCNAAL
ncbi:MAG: hypothetical protein IPN89_11480, partial [Saprospiraceae bacterium]|nr:hypothetical protein [Saprospiraceae bacterium]